MPTPGDPDAQYQALIESDPADIMCVFTQTASRCSVNLNGRVTLHDVGGTTQWASERPFQLTGHVQTDEFVAQWGRGNHNFAENPPTAMMSVVDDDTANDATMILSDPELNEGDLSYAIDVLGGYPYSCDGPVNLLINIVGRPMPSMPIEDLRSGG